jgi:hypothetical protein
MSIEQKKISKNLKTRTSFNINISSTYVYEVMAGPDVCCGISSTKNTMGVLRAGVRRTSALRFSPTARKERLILSRAKTSSHNGGEVL